MKRIFTLLFFVLFIVSGYAQTTYSITNSGFTFSPDSISIVVGDIIQWNQSSIHPVVEVTQSTWSANGNTPKSGGFSASPGGSTTFTTAGTYYYVCTNHFGAAMKGRIFVSTATSVKTIKNTTPVVNLYPTNTNTTINIAVSGGLAAKVDIIIYDILGNTVKIISSQNVDITPLEIDVTNLQQGNYFVKISGSNFSETKRFTKN